MRSTLEWPRKKPKRKQQQQQQVVSLIFVALFIFIHTNLKSCHCRIWNGRAIFLRSVCFRFLFSITFVQFCKQFVYFVSISLNVFSSLRVSLFLFINSTYTGKLNSLMLFTHSVFFFVFLFVRLSCASGNTRINDSNC